MAGILVHMAQVHPQRAIVPEWSREDRLIKARKHAGLSQTELGQLLEMHYKSIQKYELGQMTIKRGTLLGWAMACGVDHVWLEHGDYGDGPQPPVGGGDNGGEQVNMPSPWTLECVAA